VPLYDIEGVAASAIASIHRRPPADAHLAEASVQVVSQRFFDTTFVVADGERTAPCREATTKTLFFHAEINCRRYRTRGRMAAITGPSKTPAPPCLPYAC